MTRLYVICEGLTEINFVSNVLKPHLEKRAPGRIQIAAPRLDGHHTYARFKKYARNLLGRPGSNVIVTSMVDLFKLADDYPGSCDVAGVERPLERVRRIEQSCREGFGDDRFVPHFQLHEFEALVLSDLSVLAELHPNRSRELRELTDRLGHDFESPEHVNRLQPPSYRIRGAVPEYQKTTDGILVVERIGLAKLRVTCRHFGQWVDWLEGVALTG